MERVEPDPTGKPGKARPMIRITPRKTMRDVVSSLAGSSFRRVHRDGRVTFSRRIMTLRQILARPQTSTEPKA
jgi:hypothetical protein